MTDELEAAWEALRRDSCVPPAFDGHRRRIEAEARRELLAKVEGLENKWDTPDAGVYALSSALGFQTCRAAVVGLLKEQS